MTNALIDTVTLVVLLLVLTIVPALWWRAEARITRELRQHETAGDTGDREDPGGPEVTRARERWPERPPRAAQLFGTVANFGVASAIWRSTSVRSRLDSRST